MSNFKYKDLGKATVLCTFLFSQALLARDPLDLEGQNLIGPKYFTKNTRPKYDWEEKKPQGQLVKEKREAYISMHNEMARKYGLAHHIAYFKTTDKEITLVTAAKKFNSVCERLKEKEEERNEEINALGQAIVNEGTAMTKTLIDNNIQEEKIKGILTRFKDKCASFVRGFFSN